MAAETGAQSVDQIKGVDKYKFGAKVTDFPVDQLQPVDPRARGVLLHVCPYGDNYLVPNPKGLTWGNIPVTGLIVTFCDGSLIDIQTVLTAKKLDFYVADRAFKEKYGPNDPRTYPVETWTGNRVQVTLIIGAKIGDAEALDEPIKGRMELFDQSQWKKFEATRSAKLNEMLNKQYQDASAKAKSNL